MGDMMDDIRIKFSLPDHIKTLHLIRECGFEAYYCLQNLWIYVAKNSPKGKLRCEKKDLEIMGKWTGKEGLFVDNLLKIGWVDEIKDGFVMHDWKEHQPFVYKSPERKVQARTAGLASGQQRVEQKRTNSSTVSSTDSPTDGEPPSSPILSLPTPSKEKTRSPVISVRNTEYQEIVKELLPAKSKEPELAKQVNALRLLVERDGATIEPRIKNSEWKAEVYKVLRWMRADTTVRDDWKGWSVVFQSIPSLRKGALKKFINARAQCNAPSSKEHTWS